MKNRTNPVARELNKLNRPQIVKMKTVYTRKGRKTKEWVT